MRREAEDRRQEIGDRRRLTAPESDTNFKSERQAKLHGKLPALRQWWVVYSGEPISASAPHARKKSGPKVLYGYAPRPLSVPFDGSHGPPRPALDNGSNSNRLTAPFDPNQPYRHLMQRADKCYRVAFTMLALRGRCLGAVHIEYAPSRNMRMLRVQPPLP